VYFFGGSIFLGAANDQEFFGWGDILIAYGGRELQRYSLKKKKKIKKFISLPVLLLRVTNAWASKA